jgi:hypothetical protein
MMTPPGSPQPPNLKKIIGGQFLVSIALLIGAGTYLAERATASIDQQSAYIMAAAAMILLFSAGRIEKLISSANLKQFDQVVPANPQSKLVSPTDAAAIVGLAVREAAAVIGLVITYLTANAMWVQVIGSASLCMMLLAMREAAEQN